MYCYREMTAMGKTFSKDRNRSKSANAILVKPPIDPIPELKRLYLHGSTLFIAASNQQHMLSENKNILSKYEFYECLEICDNKLKKNDWIYHYMDLIPDPLGRKYSEFLSLLALQIYRASVLLKKSEYLNVFRKLTSSPNIDLNYAHEFGFMGKINLLYLVVFCFHEAKHSVLYNDERVVFNILLRKGAKISCQELDNTHKPLYSSILNDENLTLRKSIRLVIANALEESKNQLRFQKYCVSKYEQHINCIKQTGINAKFHISNSMEMDRMIALPSHIEKNCYPQLETILLCHKTQRNKCSIGLLPKILLLQILFPMIVEIDMNECLER